MCVPAWEGSNQSTPWLHGIIWCTAWCHHEHTPLLPTSLMETEGVDSALMRSDGLMQVECKGCYWLDISCTSDRIYLWCILFKLLDHRCMLVFIRCATLPAPWHHQDSNTESLSLCEQLPVWPRFEPEPVEKRSIYPQRWMLGPSKWTIRKEHHLRRNRRVMEHSLNPPSVIDWRHALRQCLREQLQ